MRRAGRAVAILACAAVAPAGCGGQPHRSAAACPPKPGAASEPALTTCLSRADGAKVRVTVDTNPQAYRRWGNSLVERTQTSVEWAQHPAQRPRMIDGLGLGAYWVRAGRQLFATDGSRLVTVAVVTKPRGGPAASAIARDVTRRALGRVVRPPPRSGP